MTRLSHVTERSMVLGPNSWRAHRLGRRRLDFVQAQERTLERILSKQAVAAGGQVIGSSCASAAAAGPGTVSPEAPFHCWH